MNTARPEDANVSGAWKHASSSRPIVAARTWRGARVFFLAPFALLGACSNGSSPRGGDASCSDAEDGGDPSDDARPPDDDGGADGDASACPPEMVLVHSVGVCIDRYEASRGDADAATSLPGVMPWSRVRWRDAGEACRRSGKRLCLPDEWEAACRGPLNFDFPYGPEAQDANCNIAQVDPDAGEPTLFETGGFDRCEGGYSGVFDMIGNVAEWTDSSRYQEDAGGELALATGESSWGDWSDDCSTETWWASSAEVENIGFRCCLTP